MLKQRNVKYYSKKLAKEMGITQKQAHAILSYAFRNIVRMQELQQDIRLTGLGRLYIEKKHVTRKPKT